MKASTLLLLLPLLPLDAARAMTTTELIRHYHGLSAHETPTISQRRAMERYLCELTGQDSGEGELNILACIDGHPPRYYLRDRQLTQWFLDRRTALNLRFAADTLRGALGRTDQLNLGAMEGSAAHVIAKDPEARRISERVRLASDGYGRLAPDIRPECLAAAMDAVTRNRRLRFDYVSSKGQASSLERTILGLVGKDSTIYLVGVEGLSDTPHHFALHRVRSAAVSHQPAQERVGFDLSQYIIDTNQFSHPLYENSLQIRLVLRIDPVYIYHFRERRLSEQQLIEEPTAEDPWYRLSASVPNTYMLPPFLWSMCPGIEVLEPKEIRDHFVDGVRRLASFYLKTS
jgi:predicted DNA-binding transcriptional regulator YafY